MTVAGNQPLMMATAIVVVALLLVFHRTVLSILRFALRPVGRLFRAVRRVLASLRFASLAAPEVKPLQSIVGVGVGSLARVLNETDEAIARHLGPTPMPIVPKRGLFCTWINPQFPHDTLYEREHAEEDLKKAREFFTAGIPTHSNPLNLYDDIEGAFLVNLFRGSDLACFHVLAEFRKVITRNILHLTVLFSLIVSVIVVADFQLSAWIGDRFDVPEAFQAYLSKPVFNQIVLGALSFLCGYFLLLFLYHAEYKHFQRYNGQQLNNFLNRYLAEINANFRKIQTNATNAIVEEKEVGEVKRDLVLWITNLQWMAFRVFFIECYVRNVIFQIRRYSSYCLIFVPPIFAVALLSTYLISRWPPTLSSFDASVYAQGVLYVFVAFLLLAYYRYLAKSMDAVSQSIEGQWFKFRDLNLMDAMTRTIESYAHQLDQWRTRYNRGGP
jgi:hypothetical protein